MMESQTTPDIGESISKVRDLLSSPDRWTKCREAEDAKGFACAVDDPEACKFCLMGALHRVYGGTSKRGPAYERLRQVLELHYHHQGALCTWNDDPKRAFDDVRQLLELADV